MKKSDIRANTALRLAVVLFLLTLISAHILSGLLAKYCTSDNDVNTARVASFSVSASGQPEGVEMSAQRNGDNTYSITLTNNSEVAVSCAMEIKFNKPLPKGVSVKIDSIAPSEPFKDNTLKFDRICELNIGGTYTAELVFDVDWNAYAEENKTYIADFSAVISFVQID